uniref:Uncharacterized protein n=1 Tax=Anopheles funestus TaxID=62324 RepID=A0A182S1V2_ANOFN
MFYHPVKLGLTCIDDYLSNKNKTMSYSLILIRYTCIRLQYRLFFSIISSFSLIDAERPSDNKVTLLIPTNREAPLSFRYENSNEPSQMSTNVTTPRLYGASRYPALFCDPFFTQVPVPFQIHPTERLLPIQLLLHNDQLPVALFRCFAYRFELRVAEIVVYGRSHNTQQSTDA